jgi:hypothetical protein
MEEQGGSRVGRVGRVALVGRASLVGRVGSRSVQGQKQRGRHRKE